jgi:hypothetical protein
MVERVVSTCRKELRSEQIRKNNDRLVRERVVVNGPAQNLHEKLRTELQSIQRDL